MGNGQDLFEAMGRESGCMRLARDFYARVAEDPDLRPLFPGKNLRCATEELAAFLIQFFHGDENKTQYRWWLSLRASHARFQINERQRTTWLRHMAAALESVVTDAETCTGLRSFFETAAAHILGSNDTNLPNPEIDKLWHQQRSLDQLIQCIADGLDAEAIALAATHSSRKSVTVGIMARMMEADREPLTAFVLDSLKRDPGLSGARFNGRFPLHFAAGSGCLSVVQTLLATGTDPNVEDLGGYTPLYRVANGCGTHAGDQIVRELIHHGALVNHAGGVTRSTALHAAARRGHLAIAMALIEAGASLEARDRKGFTALDRARNCRQQKVAAALDLRRVSSL